jgi:hypothetical protein
MRYTLSVNYSDQKEDGFRKHSKSSGGRLLDMAQQLVMEKELFYRKQVVLMEHDDDGSERVLLAALVPMAVDRVPVTMLAFGKLVTLEQVEG